MVKVVEEDEKPHCEYCKFCAVRCDSWNNEPIEWTKAYYCKFFPQEIHTSKNNWCGQFKPNVKENERNGDL